MRAKELEVIQKLVSTLNEMPDTSAHLAMEPRHGERRYDAQVEMTAAGRTITLLVEVKQHLYPRDVHQYLYQMREVTERAQIHFSGSVLLLLAAQNISPGAREILRKSRSAYFDFGGSLFIASNGFLIDRERPPSPSEERAMRTLFTGTRARVLLAMLDRPKEWVNVKQVSGVAGVSTATVSEVFQAMERNDWMMTDGAGPTKQRSLTKPGDVLDAWAKFVETRKAPKQRRYYVPESFIDMTYHLPQVFEQHNVEYALTGEAAAQHYAPWLTHISVLRFRLVSSNRIESALSKLEAKATAEGANLSVLEVSSPKDILFRKREGTIWYAHPVQVYLDLLKLEGRAKDAATHLREERIGF